MNLKKILTQRIASEHSELLILPDGKILAHNITPIMAKVLSELDPADEAMNRRGGTGLRPVVSGVAPETGESAKVAIMPHAYPEPCLPTKSGATPDLTGVTPVPPLLKIS